MATIFGPIGDQNGFFNGFFIFHGLLIIFYGIKDHAIEHGEDTDHQIRLLIFKIVPQELAPLSISQFKVQQNTRVIGQAIQACFSLANDLFIIDIF